MTRGPARILVVDDEPDVRLMLRISLAILGHDVVEAADGEDALAILEAVDVDAVLLDIRMPGLDGLTVLERIRSSARHADLPVLLCTADLPSLLDERALLAAGCLAKPFLPVDIESVVGALLTGAPLTAPHAQVTPYG